jgi:hypothetical protein
MELHEQEEPKEQQAQKKLETLMEQQQQMKLEKLHEEERAKC